MTTTVKDPILVVIQLTGGNDGINTVIPYNDPLYYDNRPTIGISQDQVLPIDDHLAFHPAMEPIKALYDRGKVAVISGVGYPKPSRSHFRSMDIWHTCEPEKQGTEGWLGRIIRDLDPNAENVLTGLNFGRGLPRALACPGVPVASVAKLETYGVLTGITDEDRRMNALDIFARMYAPVSGSGPVLDYLGQTGMDALKGADILKTAPGKYTSSVEYAASDIGSNLQGISQVLHADLGSRIFNTQHNGYDHHANQAPTHSKLLTQLSQGISDFYADLEEHNAADRVLMFVFTEFGRRVHDNGSGTDHGAAGVALVIGDGVKSGSYGEYPSLALEALPEGDICYTTDFRRVYSTMIEKWLGLDAVPIVAGNFEQLDFISS